MTVVNRDTVDLVKGRVAGLALVSALVLSACATAAESDGGLCPTSLKFRGHTYYPVKTEHRVRGDKPLADVRFACLTDDRAGREDARARFHGETLKGVDPAVAFVVPSEWPRYLFYFGPSNASTFPPEIRRLINH